jgi:hypothetical protein
MAADEDGLGFRTVAADALTSAAGGVDGALRAAGDVLAAAGTYKKELKGELEAERAPFLDERGRPEDMYRGALRRIETRFVRRERRAERDYIDRVLLAASALLRDQLVAGVGGEPSLRLNVDLRTGIVPGGVIAAASGLGAVEEARAALAEDMNRNPRLVLEQAFLQVADAALPAGTG